MDTNKKYIETLARGAKTACTELALKSANEKNKALEEIAVALERAKRSILAANAQDAQDGEKAGLSAALIDRLTLTEKRFSAMVEGVRQVIKLPDPAGRVLSEITRPNGLKIRKISVPIGVIAIIYESRPNVTIDSAALCLKAGNAVILKGGSESLKTNKAAAAALKEGLRAAGFPEEAVQLIDVKDREAVRHMLTLDHLIDLVIPRGGEGLVRTVAETSTIPVIKHYKGVCHVYVDKAADLRMADEIVFNAKVQRPGVCNAMECLIVHRDIAKTFLSSCGKRLTAAGVELIGTDEVNAIIPCSPATEESWTTEYLDLKLNVKIAGSAGEAVEHINKYGSHHSDSIVTDDAAAAHEFLSRVDSAAVFHNASTRFTDGGEFGMGAEIGISTDRIHARGPMGLEELTTYKYVIHGSGQIRT